MTSTYGLGAVPSPVDSQDYPLSRAPGIATAPTAFPPTYMLPNTIPLPLNQNGFPYCVGYAVTGVKNYQEHLQTGKWLYDDASADRVYYRCKQVDGWAGDGTFLRTGLQVAQSYGVVAANGHRYLIGSYYNLLADGDPLTNIKTTLVYYKRPVLIVTPWYENWWTLGRNYTLRAPSGGLAGFHAYWVYGYADGSNGATGLRCEQSWGLSWGNKGRFYLPWQYATPTDLWATIDR